jgi:hypothetical protein
MLSALVAPCRLLPGVAREPTIRLTQLDAVPARHASEGLDALVQQLAGDRTGHRLWLNHRVEGGPLLVLFWALLQTMGGNASARLVEGIGHSDRVEFQLFSDKLERFGQDRGAPITMRPAPAGGSTARRLRPLIGGTATYGTEKAKTPLPITRRRSPVAMARAAFGTIIRSTFHTSRASQDLSAKMVNSANTKTLRRVSVPPPIKSWSTDHAARIPFANWHHHGRRLARTIPMPMSRTCRNGPAIAPTSHSNCPTPP